MAVAFGSAGTRLLVSTASTSWAVPYPASIAAGDVLILHIVSTAAPSSTPPTGWTEVYRETTVSNPKGGVYYKVASGSESGNLTVTMGSSTGNAMMFRYTGVDASVLDGTPTVVSNTATTLTSVMASITTTAAGSMLIYCNGANSGSTTMSSTTGTERVDHGALGGTNARAGGLYDELLGAAGATGTRTIDLSASRANWGAMLALKQDAGGPPAFIGTLTNRVAGISATPSSAVRVAVKTGSVTSARLKLGTNSGLTTGVVYGSAATPDANGYATLTATGLTANTRYYYRVEMTDTNSTVELDSAATIGRIKTAPTGQASFAFDFGSCANSTDPIVFPLITARADDMFFHLGDMFYNDGSGTTLANIRSKLEGKIQSTNHAALYAQINMAHTPGDHDVAQNDSNNGSDPTAWGNYRTASAELFPDVDFYYTWVWGRVRFIKLDIMNFADNRTDTDDSSKTLLGTTQKQWFKDTIDAATEPLIFIVQSDPWIGSAITSDAGWQGFTTERTELANHMSASGKNIIIIAGDMHAAAADDGTNSPGGIPVFHGSPFGQTASQKGGPYTTGPIPSSGTAFTTHYGRVVITDTGATIAAAFNAYDSTDTSVVNLTMTYDLAVPATLSGSGTLTSTQTPAASAAGTLSGSGTLAPAVTVAFSKNGGLSGSGTLTTSGITPGASPAGTFSSEGTLAPEQDAVTVSSSAALSSTGTLTKAVVANFTASMTQTSTGTLAASVTGMSAAAAPAFSGSGTLTSTRTPAANTSGTLSGSGTLSSTQSVAIPITVNFTSEGTLTAGSSNSFTRNATLSGSGTLTQTNTPALNASAALSGSGTLSVGVVVNRSVSASLSGSGTLSSTLTSVGIVKTSGLSGSGTLSATGVVNRTAFPNLSGSGTLGTNIVPGLEYVFVGSSSGTLTTEETPALAVTAQFSGVGTLVADTGDLFDYEVTGYLAAKRWSSDLGSKRWKGSL